MKKINFNYSFSTIYKLSILLFIVASFPVHKHFLYSIWAFVVSPNEIYFATFFDILYWVLLISLFPFTIYYYTQYHRLNSPKGKNSTVPLYLIITSFLVFIIPFEKHFTNLIFRVTKHNRENVIKYIANNSETFHENYTHTKILSLSKFGFISAGNKINIYPRGNDTFVVMFPDHQTKFKKDYYVYVPANENCFNLPHKKVIYYNEHWCHISAPADLKK